MSARDDSAGMYAPEVHLAYEALQRELENFLFDAGVAVRRIHSKKDRFKELDIYVYEIMSPDGREIGKVSYRWGEADIIVVDIRDDDRLQSILDAAFGNEEEKFNKYVDEFRKKLWGE